jgi:hypothetical protein
LLAAVSGVGLWRLGAIERGVEQVICGDARVAGEMAQFVRRSATSSARARLS